MYKVEIEFNAFSIEEVYKALDKIKEQISYGEFHGNKNPKGYLPNKHNSIDIINKKELWDIKGYKIGTFNIIKEV